MLIDLLARGGPLVPPLLLLSFVAVAVSVERLAAVARAARLDAAPAREALDLFRAGDRAAALARCAASEAPLARVIARGLEAAGADRATLEATLGHAVEAESARLARRLPLLAGVTSAAPMLGLFGTVLGLIEAFRVIERAGGAVDAAMLAGGIWEAMLTTALGLAAALPALVVHEYLRHRILALEEGLRDGALRLLAHRAESRREGTS